MIKSANSHCEAAYLTNRWRPPGLDARAVFFKLRQTVSDSWNHNCSTYDTAAAPTGRRGRLALKEQGIIMKDSCT